MNDYTILHHDGTDPNYGCAVDIVRMHNDNSIRIAYDNVVDLVYSFVDVPDALAFLYDYMA